MERLRPRDKPSQPSTDNYLESVEPGLDCDGRSKKTGEGGPRWSSGWDSTCSLLSPGFSPCLGS